MIGLEFQCPLLSGYNGALYTIHGIHQEINQQVMASLDEEFALFQEELKSLEAQESKKRQRENYDEKVEHSSESALKKSKVLNEKQKIETKVVIASAPKVYAAPPRPSHILTSIAKPQEVFQSESSSSSAALSGFPAGMSGEAIAALSSTTTTKPVVQRVDMVTGQILSAEEQHMMNMQQSVYGYDPHKQVRANTSAGGKSKRNLRMAGGEVWEDPTLAEWPENDFRLFIGDLGNEVNDELLVHSFSRYASFQKAKVIRDKHTQKSKGFGFVSFNDPFDCAKAMKEMNGKYIGNRPVKIRKSKWEERNIDVARKKMKRKKKKHHLFN
jgi:hypothetical protein